jgi:predicted O-methyltransferase YrrM
MIMNETLHALLDDLYAEGRAFDATQEDRLARRRNVEPDTAALIAVLIRATRPRRVLELGTSNGYSTLWLAEAASAVGAALVSVDVEAQRTEQARANLTRGGLAGAVELRTEDAADTLAGSGDGEWGLIFLDAERPAYISYWPDLVRTLAPGGLLVVDNVLSHADQVADFRALVAADDRVREALAPTGAGALLIVNG